MEGVCSVSALEQLELKLEVTVFWNVQDRNSLHLSRTFSNLNPVILFRSETRHVMEVMRFPLCADCTRGWPRSRSDASQLQPHFE